jgi:nucleotide-binding universal stress UspA family protein
MRTMLVAIDFSDVTASVVKTASDWAAAGGYRVHLFYVVPEEADLVGYESGMQLMPKPAPAESPDDHRLMATCHQELTQRNLDVTTRIAEGLPASEILDEAASVGADVIVMGTHRHGMLHHLLLGSVSSGVLKRTTCPVLVVPSVRHAEGVTGPGEKCQAAL